MPKPEKPSESPLSQPTGVQEEQYNPDNPDEVAQSKVDAALDRLEVNNLDQLVKLPDCDGTVYKKGADYYIQGRYNHSNGDEVFYKVGQGGALEKTPLTNMVGGYAKGKLTEKYGWSPVNDLSREETLKLTTLGLSEATVEDVNSLQGLQRSKEFNGSTVYEKGGVYYILGYNPDAGDDIVFEMSEGGALQRTALTMNGLIGGRSVGKFTKEGKWNALFNLPPQEVNVLKRLGLSN